MSQQSSNRFRANMNKNWDKVLNQKHTIESYNSNDWLRIQNLPAAYFAGISKLNNTNIHMSQQDLSNQNFNTLVINKLPETSMTNNDMGTAGIQAIRGIQIQDDISTVFFSKDNIDLLQKTIKMVLYKKTGYVIGRQDDTELLAIMRAMFIQYSRNLVNCTPDIIRGEVKCLNVQVVNYSVPKINTAVKQYYAYLQDTQSFPVPVPLPVATSNAGTKSLNPSIPQLGPQLGSN